MHTFHQKKRRDSNLSSFVVAANTSILSLQVVRNTFHQQICLILLSPNPPLKLNYFIAHPPFDSNDATFHKITGKQEKKNDGYRGDWSDSRLIQSLQFTTFGDQN